MEIQEFIDRWRNTQASERANKDSYLKELCRVLLVPEPDGRTGDPGRDGYVFEADAILYDEDGRRHVGKMDLYRRGCFVLEAKQGSAPGSAKARTATWGTPGWNLAMTDAAGQAFGYARTLDEPPPFVVVADIGYCFDLYAAFDGSGAYRPFPNGQRNRLYVKDLEKHSATLRQLWIDPLALDPRRRSERVTHEVAADLSRLAVELETAGHPSELVARFLMRCIFTMFAEDVGLLRDNVFTQYLQKQWLVEPESFKDGIEELWAAMNAGKKFYVLGKLLRFNGGLFSSPSALPLSGEHLRVLEKAARHDWSEVEPAIFGTLIERALNPRERHKLGAHFTPPEYVRRLLVPTIEEPLRAAWDLVRVRVRELVPPGEVAKPTKLAQAQAVVQEFREQLCKIRVLDPACGTGNFLYVAFHLFKQLESEVLSMLDDLGVTQLELGEDLSVTPKQFLGIEVRAESKEIAELVLWVGYLQWHHKMFGGARKPPEPILRDYKNIECRDALLAFDKVRPLLDSNGQPITRWDGETTRLSSTTDEPVPDESARVQVYEFIGVRRADWPAAEFVIGNPPFVGNKRMKLVLGDGYVDVLRKVHNDVPKSADLVMYWWQKAATLARTGKVRRAGLITTNSITQGFNQRIVETQLSAGGSLVYAVPDHPWVDDKNGAQVRVAMTVFGAGRSIGRVDEVFSELEDDTGRVVVALEAKNGVVNSALGVGVSLSGVVRLASNRGLTCPGVQLSGQGFVLNAEEVERFCRKTRDALVRPYVTGRDLTKVKRTQYVIDTYGKTESDLKSKFPDAFQWLADRVKPERQQNPRASYAKNWWLHSEPRSKFRGALVGLDRYIGTSRTARHRVFQFLPKEMLAETKVLVIASDDAAILGVLSSRAHVVFANARGGWLGVGNDSTYNHSACFDPFPFPAWSDAARKQIADLAEELDAHRKARQLEHPKLTITDMYNVLEKVGAGQPLDDAERRIHEQSLGTVLVSMHEELDELVLGCYGLGRMASDQEILAAIVSLNAERASLERTTGVRWLRPDFQSRITSKADEGAEQDDGEGAQLLLPWPKDLPQQVAAVRDALSSESGAVTAALIAERYDGASAALVEPALDTLVVLGIAASFVANNQRCWKGLARTSGERAGAAHRSSHPPPLTGATGS